MHEAVVAKRYAEAVYGVAKEKDKVKEIRNIQMEVREYLDDLILMDKEPVS